MCWSTTVHLRVCNALTINTDYPVGADQSSVKIGQRIKGMAGLAQPSASVHHAS